MIHFLLTPNLLPMHLAFSVATLISLSFFCTTVVMINRERLKQTFVELCEIESPSRKEGEVAWYITKVFRDELGHEVVTDDSSQETGSETGNLVVRIEGTNGDTLAPLLFNAHMDTVGPTEGVKVLFEDGIFRTDGTTILGGDDKAAIAILMEVARCLKEQDGQLLPPLEFLFTVCEEIGLLGAKALDASILRARAGYALDTTGTFNLINRAPCAIRFSVKVHGKSAHAGIAPEKGINAISLAARAISKVPLGRIDPETTANIGIIRGGKATNIVPDLVEIEGEVRSHSEDRLKKVQDQVLAPFHQLQWDFDPKGEGPVVQVDVIDDYPVLNVPEDHRLVTTAREAAASMGRELKVETTGGGSDANILCGKGIDTVILGIGMENVHTTDEHIALSDMVECARFILEIISKWGLR